MRSIYRVYDNSDYWDYSAESRAEARAEHLRLNYEEAGLPLEDWPENLEISKLPPSKVITIGDAGEKGETITHTAQEWAEAEEGLIGTTCV